MSLSIQCLCVDTTDPSELATFWEGVLGWRRTYADEDEVVLEPPAGSTEDGVVPDLAFLRVPEERVARTVCTWICGPSTMPGKSSVWSGSGRGGWTSDRAPTSAGSCWRIRTGMSSASFAR
jgi:hypothetical protein